MNKKSIIVYLTIWLISVLSFWIMPIKHNEISYSIIVFYVLLPMLTLVTSINISNYKNKTKYITPILFGALYMCAEYLTFSLSNMISFHKLNVPELEMLLIGSIISYIGIFIGSKRK